MEIKNHKAHIIQQPIMHWWTDNARILWL